MSAKPYNPTLKDLVEVAPRAWPALFSRPTGPTEVIDADIGTVTGTADKVLRVHADPNYLLHLEFAVRQDVVKLPSKVNTHNALLEHRHGLRVRSGIVLLRPEADSPQWTGTYERGFPAEESYRIFRYRVLRVLRTTSWKNKSRRPYRPRADKIQSAHLTPDPPGSAGTASRLGQCGSGG